MYLKFMFSSVRFEVFTAVMVHVVVFRVMTLRCDVVWLVTYHYQGWSDKYGGYVHTAWCNLSTWLQGVNKNTTAEICQYLLNQLAVGRIAES